MIEVKEQIDAVVRRVGPGSLAGADARTVELSQVFPVPAGALWATCTEPERIARWFQPVSGDLRVGGRYQVEGNAGGTVERCEPPGGFAVTWEFGEQASRLEVGIEAAGASGARLDLVHVVPLDPHWEQFGPGAVGVGWDMGLMGLATHLASGVSLDPAEGAAWAASEDGLAFVRASATAWRDAHLASGDDAAMVQGMADRTLAAYTGQPPA